MTDIYLYFFHSITDITIRNYQYIKTHNMTTQKSNTDSTKSERRCSRRVSSSCFLYDTVVLQSSFVKILPVIDEIQNLRKDPLTFGIWIFRSGQPVRGDDCIICVAMPSTQEQRSLAWIACASAAELCPEDHCTGHKLQTNV